MIRLGEIVIDKITGASGVATARLEELYKATQIFIEPQGNLEQPPMWYAESRVNGSGQMYDNFSISVEEREMDEVKNIQSTTD